MVFLKTSFRLLFMAFVYTLCTAWGHFSGGHFSGVPFFDILLFTHKKKGTMSKTECESN